MAEYIEREALISELQEEIEFETSMYTEEQNKYFNIGLKCAIRDVKSHPAADVVEVVRCKDCENCLCINDRYMCKRNAIYDNRNDEFHGLCAVKKEHFCSYGERKDKE